MYEQAPTESEDRLKNGFHPVRFGTVQELYQQCIAGTRVSLVGTIQEVRFSQESNVLVVTDHSTIKPVSVHLKRTITAFSEGMTIRVSGLWSKPRPSTGAASANEYIHPDAEILSAEVEVVGTLISGPNPVTAKDTSPETLWRNPHLRIRLPYYALLARFRSVVVSALTMFFDQHPGGPFYQVHLPIIHWTDCEGGNEVFSIFNQTSKQKGSQENDRFFGDRRYLAVTAALHGEPFVQGLGRIWTLAPCFRAEGMDDDRHLAEFWMLEIALDHITELDVLFELMETMLNVLVTYLRNSAVGKEMLEHSEQKDLHRRWEMLSNSPFPRIKVQDAIELLKSAQLEGRASFSNPPEQGGDLKAEHEIFLVKHFNSPVFLTHFYTNTRLFTALQSSPPDPNISLKTTTTESFDLLLPDIAEVCSGGLREHRLDVLLQVMRRKGFFKNSAPEGEPANYPGLQTGEALRSLEWFADLRRYGTTPHGGFGIGFERLLMYLTGASSVKDTISFPRYPGVCGC